MALSRDIWIPRLWFTLPRERASGIFHFTRTRKNILVDEGRSNIVTITETWWSGTRVWNIPLEGNKFRQMFVLQACCLTPRHFFIKLDNIFSGVLGEESYLFNKYIVQKKTKNPDPTKEWRELYCM